MEFDAESGLKLRGWLFVPEGRSRPRPAVRMAHGYAGVKEHGLERFAQGFAEAGFVVLVHDHRNFGASDGAERGDLDPWQQIADWRLAISFLESRPEVDAAHIGIWGTSYAGGHAIVLGATDRRLRAVVAQVPTISGFEQGLRRIPPEGIATSPFVTRELLTTAIFPRFSRARSASISSAGHWPHLEQPVAVAKAIDGFLAQIGWSN